MAFTPHHPITLKFSTHSSPHSSKSTSAPLLQEVMIEEMLRPQLPSAAWLTGNAIDPRGIAISGNVLFPSSPVNHALGFIVHDSDLETGARKGTAEGAGMTNTFWWLDRESGVAGLCFLNLLPYMDVQAVALAKEYQAQVYRSIASVKP